MNKLNKKKIIYISSFIFIIVLVLILILICIWYILKRLFMQSNSISYLFNKCLGPNITNEKKICNGKFISYKRTNSGFNNLRMQFETLISIAYITNRTLILPPKSHIDHIKNDIDEFDVFDWDTLSFAVCLTREEPNIDKYNIPITQDSHKFIDNSILDKYKDKKYWYFEDLTLPSSECYLKLDKITKQKQRKMLNENIRFKNKYISIAVDLLHKHNLYDIGSYNSVHFRRGDYVTSTYYKDNNLGDINKYNEFISKFNFKNKPLLFISNTDKDLIKTELEKEYKAISINIDSYSDLESTIIDMLLCCGSYKFIGSPYSTMSIYIFMLRGKIYRECKCIDDSIIYLKDLGFSTTNCECELPSCFYYVSKDIWLNY